MRESKPRRPLRRPRRPRRRVDAEHTSLELIPLVVRDYMLEVLQEDGMRERMKHTIRRGLDEDPDFALRFLRFVAELQREIGPQAGLGGQISIVVRTNLDDEPTRAADPADGLSLPVALDDDAQ
jgi:hypothetical protein